MNERRMEKIEDGVSDFLEPGENFRVGICGQTPISLTPLVLIPILFIVALVIVRNRLVVVTDRNVYLLAGKYFKPMNAKGLIEKHPLGSVEASYRYPLMPVVRVGGTSVWVHWFHGKDAKAVVEHAQRPVTQAA